MSRRLRRRALLGLLFACLCVLALAGIVLQALGLAARRPATA
jgi:hypothetical protein